MTMDTADDILAIYRGSDGSATKALYDRLQGLPPRGVIALNLFRACKASERAKAYRGKFVAIWPTKKRTGRWASFVGRCWRSQT